ncbi:uncharacterized protein LOC126666527 [Mercurialis annua]|uniref:uncharacterized protein LOC126666527 n=1 Tax=Mercurialis annua TaxID=3986 RepID=UPI00215E27BB|nr:uncharacterized protein LOC126666527 [Mercurialis annua]
MDCDAFRFEERWCNVSKNYNKMFEGLDCLEVYIDDVVIKSSTNAAHLADLRKGFERFRTNGLKMNPLKCTFRVSTRNFLGFLVHQREVEVDKNKAKVIVNAEPPQTKKQLQRLIGQIKFLRRFISNTVGRLRSRSVLLKGNETDHFVWTTEQQLMFDELKKYLVVYSLKRTKVLKERSTTSKAVKGQVLADFLADDPGIGCMELNPCRLWFDGSRTDRGAGAGIVIVSSSGARFTMSCSLNFKCTNNQAEYEALILGLEILMELGATAIQVWGDSMLVIKQVAGEYKCESELLIRYCNKAKHLIGGFSDTWLEYTKRSDNIEANDLAQHGSGYKPCYEYEAIHRDTPNLVTRGEVIFEAVHSVYQLDFSTDWRKELIKWFDSPNMTNRRLRTLALNYVVLADELYKRGSDGLLFRCIGPREAMLVMAEVHEGIAGAHQDGPRMR